MKIRFYKLHMASCAVETLYGNSGELRKTVGPPSKWCLQVLIRACVQNGMGGGLSRERKN